MSFGFFFVYRSFAREALSPSDSAMESVFLADLFLGENNMQLYIAGGCGDQGRNCFYIEGDRHAFIVDAGTSTDGLDRLPDLSPEMIRRAEYLFVTHSHKDHTGAIEYLENNGFTGPVLMSNQTYQQIHYKPKNTMILDSTAPELSLDGELSLRWGRTGHCAGAVWYYITVDGKRLFFSGDYRENDTFYRCDAVRGLTADLAVIDSAYSRMDRAEDMRKAVADAAKEALGQLAPLLLPVPSYGRGLSMAMLFYQTFGEAYPIHMSAKLRDQWLRIGHRGYFAHEEILGYPFDIFRSWDETSLEGGHIYFLTDAQLSKAKSRQLIDCHPELSVLMTGSLHGYGKAKSYYESGRAAFVLWPNHLTKQETADLAAANAFSLVVPFHNPKEKPETDVYSF